MNTFSVPDPHFLFSLFLKGVVGGVTGIVTKPMEGELKGFSNDLVANIEGRVAEPPKHLSGRLNISTCEAFCALLPYCLCRKE